MIKKYLPLFLNERDLNTDDTEALSILVLFTLVSSALLLFLVVPGLYKWEAYNSLAVVIGLTICNFVTLYLLKCVSKNTARIFTFYTSLLAVVVLSTLLGFESCVWTLLFPNVSRAYFQNLPSRRWVRNIYFISTITALAGLAYIHHHQIYLPEYNPIYSRNVVSNGYIILVISVLLEIVVVGSFFRLVENYRKKIISQSTQVLNYARMSAVGEMAGGMAHEINNPLTVIIPKIDIMVRKINDANYSKQNIADDLLKIQNSAQRIANIIKGLRDFSQNSDTLPLEIKTASNIISSTLDLFSEKIKSKGIQLVVYNKSVSEVKCRPSQISQVLINLLSNSIDALEGLDKKWIELVCYENDLNIFITICDSGAKLDDELAEKIMLPFFTTKPVGQATGLGLSISKGIIESHGGKFYYDANSENVKFVIELPKYRRQMQSSLH